ncbi:MULTISPECIES: potassium channel family protein [unclassified Leptolyngbya]|uniref:potassium channel family protein n=1 Tax=unclassified Leptolyngbya TaxID=2650499 RepID=UPI0016870C4D|nr:MULTISPECIES: potassium channel family protein [unclassified Leptolyngbya]MBD1913509.1 two pore domain potassium channel family protein [Leptolyngbya sp. FACHB-8]MBD2153269.1 two pore domain potassium channel family protein [Leptolyngbya sp. FACHB-16]
MLLFLGALILLIVFVDVLVTTLILGGGGPLTNRILGKIWRFVLRIHHWHPNHHLLFLISWLLLIFTAWLWFSLAFLGWCLIFSSSDQALVKASTGEYANLWERIYFVLYTLSTLGLGDFEPSNTFWQFATAIASISGFALLSLIITYLLPVVSAATNKRQLALYISSLGGTPEEILTRAWNGKDFGQLNQHFISLTSQITLLGEQHVTYPILYYFHSAERSRSFALSLVALDEALTLLSYGVSTSVRPDPASIGPLRRANASFLKTLTSAYLKPSRHCLPPPSLEELRAYGIPTVSHHKFEEALEMLELRRRALLTLIWEDGWPSNAAKPLHTLSRANDLDDDFSIKEVLP